MREASASLTSLSTKSSATIGANPIVRVENPSEDYKILSSIGKTTFFLCERKSDKEQLTLSARQITMEN